MPRKRYDEVNATFVRRAIAAGDFDDTAHREYVDDLIALESYVEDPPSGFGGGVHFGTLRNRYPEAYDAIQAELDPASFRTRKRREAQRDERAFEVETTQSPPARRADWERVSHQVED